jgi:hypothetical protein
MKNIDTLGVRIVINRDALLLFNKRKNHKQTGKYA